MANVNQRVTDFFIPIARDVIGNNNVFANRQPLDTGFPSIVFTFVGENIVPVYGGPMRDVIAMRYDLRAQAVADLYELDSNLRSRLLRSGRMITDSGAVDIYDDEFSVHRRVRTLGFRL